MNGIEQLHPQNRTLYVQVQRMLNLRMKYEDICDVVGLVGANRVNELCEWFIAYKTPKAMPLVSTGQVLDVPVRSRAVANDLDCGSGRDLVGVDPTHALAGSELEGAVGRAAQRARHPGRLFAVDETMRLERFTIGAHERSARGPRLPHQLEHG